MKILKIIQSEVLAPCGVPWKIYFDRLNLYNNKPMALCLNKYPKTVTTYTNKLHMADI
jgi:hypothetical protein